MQPRASPLPHGHRQPELFEVGWDPPKARQQVLGLVQKEKTKLAPPSHFHLLCVSRRRGAQVPRTVLSAVGEAPLSRRGLGPEAVFVQRAGIVGGCVHIGLLQWVEIGSVIWDQVILVQGLWKKEGTREERVRERWEKGRARARGSGTRQ